MSSHRNVDVVDVSKWVIFGQQLVDTDPAGILTVTHSTIFVTGPATITGFRILDPEGDPVTPPPGLMLTIAGWGAGVLTLEHLAAGVIVGERLHCSSAVDVSVDPFGREIQVKYRETAPDGSSIDAWLVPDWS